MKHANGLWLLFECIVQWTCVCRKMQDIRVIIKAVSESFMHVRTGLSVYLQIVLRYSDFASVFLLKKHLCKS